LATAVSVASGCGEKTEEKIVTVPSQPWYQTAGLQPTVVGEAQTLSRSALDCSRPLPLAIRGVTQVRTGYKQKTITDTLFDIQKNQASSFRPYPVTRENVTTEEVDAASTINLCDLDYPASSIEYVGLSVARDIDHAKEWYAQQPFKVRQALQDVDINVHPLYTADNYYRFSEEFRATVRRTDLDINTRSRHIKLDNVDNAFWTITEDKQPMIAFLPHQTPNSLSASQFPTALWELPFVARHEYGHHIFATHMQRIMNLDSLAYYQNLRQNPFLHSTHRIQQPLTHPLQEAAQGSPQVDNLFVIAALNEGFADLFAYYSSNETMPGLNQAPCFIETRDPASSTMQGWLTEKKWTAAFIEFLFDANATSGLVPPQELASCASFSLASPHSLGAVIAHTANELLDNSPRVLNSADPAATKTELILAWLNQLDDELNMADLGPRLVVSRVFEILASVAIEQPDSLTRSSSFCDTVNDRFSGWASLWQTSESPVQTCVALAAPE
jgi:hypothetical protein